MKQENIRTNIGNQTSKEREAVRQLFRGCLYLAITLIILIVVTLYIVL